MPTIKVIGHVDERHRLVADVPESVSPGPVEVSLTLPPPSSELADEEWAQGIAREWAADWGDPREDIYTPDDGEPADGVR